MQKLQTFVPIKNPKGHCKAFHLTKNGKNTGVFEEMPAHINNVLDENFINDLENPKMIDTDENNNSNDNNGNSQIRDNKAQNNLVNENMRINIEKD